MWLFIEKSLFIGIPRFRLVVDGVILTPRSIDAPLYWCPIILMPRYIDALLYWCPVTLTPHYIDAPLYWRPVILMPRYIDAPLYWRPVILTPRYIDAPLYWCPVILMPPMLIGALSMWCRRRDVAHYTNSIFDGLKHWQFNYIYELISSIQCTVLSLTNCCWDDAGVYEIWSCKSLA